MNTSPRDFITLEAPLAGRGYTTQTKAAGSYGQVMGNAPVLLDTGADTDASPPLLATRRSPRRMPIDSPLTDDEPMRTPSPSLFDAIPASTAVSEGLNLLALVDEEELEEGMGLGLGLPGYDSEDLITIVPGLDNPTSPSTPAAHTHAPILGLGFDIELAEWDSDDLIKVYPTHPNRSLGFGGIPAYDDDALIVDELDFDVEESPVPAYYNVLMGLTQPPAQSASSASRVPSKRPGLTRNSAPPAPIPPTAVDHADPPNRATICAMVGYGLGLLDANDEPLVLRCVNIIESPVLRRTFPDLPLVESPSPVSATNSPLWSSIQKAEQEQRDRMERAQHRMARLISLLPVIDEVNSPMERE